MIGGVAWETVGQLFLRHLYLAGVPLLIGLAISLPLGWVATRRRWLLPTVTGGTGLLYTIPSLALFILMPLLLGTRILDPVNVVAAMTVYTVALLVRTVADGLGAVPDHVQQSATAMGYGGWRRFWAVEFPLSGPVVLAGLRVMAASTIALATVGILIGGTNLGYLFTNGLQRRIIPEVFSGILAVAVVALAIDLLLVLIGRALMPWTRPSAAKRRSLSPHTAEAGEAS